MKILEFPGEVAQGGWSGKDGREHRKRAGKTSVKIFAGSKAVPGIDFYWATQHCSSALRIN